MSCADAFQGGKDAPACGDYELSPDKSLGSQRLKPSVLGELILLLKRGPAASNFADFSSPKVMYHCG